VACRNNYLVSKPKSILAVIGIFAVVWLYDRGGSFLRGPAYGDSPVTTVDQDYQSGREVEGEGTVTRILSDDNDGSRHQRFILELSSGRTLLIAHNIDLAPRVEGLRVGDSVAFRGVYEWNSKGGVIHWTHLDPDGSHAAGWLRHRGQTYQ
jgi:hypothetical protein